MLNLIKEKLGPGLLYAAAAVGVSHLVSSTTAGATYGLVMVAYVVFVCMVKYPTFLFGARYAAITGETLIDGYERMGKWVVILLFFMQIFEYTFAIAGVTATTAAIVQSVFGLDFGGLTIELVLVVSCMIILAMGRYSVLEDVSKVLVIVFTLGTVFAAAAAISSIDAGTAPLSASITFDTPTILFLVAVAGWMPTGTGGAVGLSLWVKAKSLRLGRRVTVKEANFDFNVGYFTAIFTAVCFVSLGTYVMFINGVAVEPDGAAFAAQLINLFTSTIGQWVYYIMGAAAIVVMFSSLLTLVDLFPRSSAAVITRLMPEKTEHKWGMLYVGFIFLEFFFVLGVLFMLMDSFGTFIGMVTSMGFVVAPAISLLNHLAIFSSFVPKEQQPSNILKMWSLGTIVILTAVAVLYLYLKFL